jgi:hypothetical protein
MGGFLPPPLLQPKPVVRGTPLEINLGTLLIRILDEQTTQHNGQQPTTPTSSTPIATTASMYVCMCMYICM